MPETRHYRVHAGFAGERAGAAALTWGQRGMWNAISRNPPGHFNIPMVLALPRRPSPTVERVVVSIGELVGRHEALRTQIVAVAGEPAQQVARAGRLPVEVTETGSAEAVTGIVAEVRDRLSAAAFQYPTDWPLRVGLVAVDGEVRQAVLVFCHTATDWQGAEVVATQLRVLLRGATPAAPVLQPLDMAHWQATSGKDRTRRAVDYWTDSFRSIPPTMFTADGPAHEPSHHQVMLTSRALDGATRVIAARQRVSTTTVLLAATVALVGSWTGNSICALHTLVNNRFQAGHSDVVGMLAQLALLTVDMTGGLTFEELVTRTWQAALRGHRHAYYDQAALDAALAGVRRELATEVNPYCCFNDMRSTQDTVAGDPALLPGEEAIRGALSESVLTLAPHAPLNCRFCLRVEPATGPLSVVLTADSRSLSSVQIGQFLRDLERLVVDAAFGEVRLAALPGRGRR
ncbi:hypothetical protein Rhe02_42300 [Rhizocola hellebori]|uniref:Condensation domain-containing protein n=1 Tax=Rhizocola hellebori TaxID=1392758 RepID=A0A8J3VHQ4_9ACTN|nr:condensation domain-containing protein [Rhizocola hellebori]GIH06163.1 hypothetical protein Rhe02_42300 [Rhizocola hellebori]